MSKCKVQSANVPGGTTSVLSSPLAERSTCRTTVSAAGTPTRSPVMITPMENVTQSSPGVADNCNTNLASIQQLPTLYLPPLHYTYDGVTGKLVQVTDGGSYNPQFSSLSYPMNQASDVRSPCTYSGVPASYTPRLGQSNVRTPESTAIGREACTINRDAVHRLNMLPVNDTFQRGNFFSNPTFEPERIALDMNHMERFVDADPRSQTQSTPYQIPYWYTHGNGIESTYEQALKQYDLKTQETGNWQRNTDCTGDAAQTFARKFQSTVNTAAGLSRGFDDVSINQIKDNVYKMVHHISADHKKVVIFKLERLEGVPTNPHGGLGVSYSLTVYFDPFTENYDVYKSNPKSAIPTEVSDAVDCDLKGETVKIPWNGEEFVYLNIIEHFGRLETVVGRLKLQVMSLVPGHPLRIPIIGDDGLRKGNAILEFSTGTLSPTEVRQLNDEAVRLAASRGNLGYGFGSRDPPDYDTFVQEQKQLHRNTNGHYSQRTVLRHRHVGEHRADVQIPAALNHFVRWCCGITDGDLY